MRYQNILILVIGLAWSLSACQPAQLSPQALRLWVEDPANGLHKERELGAYRFGAQLMPIPYQAVQLHKASLNAHHLSEMETELNESLDFRFRLAPKEGELSLLKYELNSVEEYQERVNYLSHEMDEYVYLLVGGDTIRPHLYHFERSFDLSPAAHVFLSFPRPEQSVKEAVLLLDDQYFGMGPVRFHFDLHRLTQLPVLILQS